MRMIVRQDRSRLSARLGRLTGTLSDGLAEPVKLHIPSAVVAADSELDWFKDDFNEVSFTGNPVLVAGYESSYSVKVFDR